MIATEFRKKLESVSAYKLSRQNFAEEVLNSEPLFPYLLSCCFQTNDKNHIKACWILELVVEQNTAWMQAQLAYFCRGIKKIKHQSALRPIAKICLLLISSHLQNQTISLSYRQMEAIGENCFDWLISENKVATKVYAIRALYLLGLRIEWIHPELKHIITKDFPSQSPAYKVAAKEVLKKIK